MSCYVKKLDKRTGVTYVYESESYWDKEKKQPRNKRKLIGKIDRETGEIVPTNGRGRPRKDGSPKQSSSSRMESVTAEYKQQLKEKDDQIRKLQDEIAQLKEEQALFLKDLDAVIQQHRNRI